MPAPAHGTHHGVHRVNFEERGGRRQATQVVYRKTGVHSA
jgi:hypothetical protein